MERPAPVVLENDVVRLEPLAARHLEGVREASEADPSIYLYYGPPVHEQGVEGWLAQALDEAARGVRLPFAVIERASGLLAGSSSYLDIAPDDGRIEIGHTWYGARFQGTRVNPAAKLLLATHAFEVLGAGRLQLKTDERNARSRAGILGVGATFEGILRQYQRRGEGPGIRDTAMYSILAAEWPVARAHLARRIAA